MIIQARGSQAKGRQRKELKEFLWGSSVLYISQCSLSGGIRYAGAGSGDGTVAKVLALHEEFDPSEPGYKSQVLESL